MAFHANLDGFVSRGIFTGPDPLLDAVIRSGDPLFGSIVDTVFFLAPGLNDSGQIAFSYSLEDGRIGIARADPLAAVPEPGSVAIFVAGLAALGLTRRRIDAAQERGDTPVA